MKHCCLISLEKGCAAAASDDSPGTWQVFKSSKKKKILLPVSRHSHIYFKKCNVQALREMLSCHSRAGHSSISSMGSRATGGHHVLYGLLVPLLVCIQQIISFVAITIFERTLCF